MSKITYESETEIKTDGKFEDLCVHAGDPDIITKLEKENDTLRSQLREAEAEVERFDYHRTPDECCSWHDKCHCTPDTCNALYDQLDKAEAKVVILRNELDETQRYWDKSHREVLELRQEVERLRKLNVEMVGMHNELSDKLREAEAEVERLRELRRAVKEPPNE